VTTASGRTYAGSADTGLEQVDYEAQLVGSKEAWRDGRIDAEILARGSGEVIEIQGRTEEIHGNLFSHLDGEYWILLASESSPRQVSKEAYENARYWSSYIDTLTPEQLDQAFGGVEALGRFMDTAMFVVANLTPQGRTRRWTPSTARSRSRGPTRPATGCGRSPRSRPAFRSRA
jgi:hypothetical protein